MQKRRIMNLGHFRAVVDCNGKTSRRTSKEMNLGSGFFVFGTACLTGAEAAMRGLGQPATLPGSGLKGVAADARAIYAERVRLDPRSATLRALNLPGADESLSVYPRPSCCTCERETEAAAGSASEVCAYLDLDGPS